MRGKNKSAKKLRIENEIQKADAQTGEPPLSKSSYKKLKKKVQNAGQTSLKGQKKLTSYFDLNSSSFFGESTPEQPQNNTNSHKIRQQIKAQQEFIEKLGIQKQIIVNRFSTLYRQTKSYKLKAKQALIQIMREKARNQRKELSKIDDKLGYLGQNNEFIYGSYYDDINKDLDQKSNQLKKIELELSKVKSEQLKNTLLFKKKFIKKEIKEIETKIKKKQPQLKQYQNRLTIVRLQRDSHYFKLKWPLIKDSQGTQKYLTLQFLKKDQKLHRETYKCFDVEQSRYAILHRIQPPSLPNQNNQKVLQDIKNYLQFIAGLKHQNLIKIIDIIVQSSQAIIYVEQYCYGMNLDNYLQGQLCLQENQGKMIIQRIFHILKNPNNEGQQIIYPKLNLSKIKYNYGKIKIQSFGIMKQNSDFIPKLSEYFPSVFAQPHQNNLQLLGNLYFQLLYGLNTLNYQNQKQIQMQLNKVTSKMYKISQDTKKIIKICLLAQNKCQQITNQIVKYLYN